MKLGRFWQVAAVFFFVFALLATPELADMTIGKLVVLLASTVVVMLGSSVMLRWLDGG